MKVGFALLTENEEGGIDEIPSNQERPEVEVTIPVITETHVESNNVEEVNASLEDLVELKNGLMKTEGVNKDFVLSLEAMVPGILKDNGLYMNGFTECLSKINYDKTVQLIDRQIGKTFLSLRPSLEDANVSKDAIEDIFYASMPDSLKNKWNEQKDKYDNVSNEELMQLGKAIAYKMYHNLNAQATNNMYNTVLSGAGEIQYVNGVPAIVTNPAFQAPSSVSDAQPQLLEVTE